jgi:hypothetical protein
LGSQVIKSCLNTIYKLNSAENYQSQIKNVYFLGGATYIKDAKLLKQKQTFSKVVCGRICNVYTQNDTTLQAFQLVYS